MFGDDEPDLKPLFPSRRKFLGAVGGLAVGGILGYGTLDILSQMKAIRKTLPEFDTKFSSLIENIAKDQDTSESMVLIVMTKCSEYTDQKRDSLALDNVNEATIKRIASEINCDEDKVRKIAQALNSGIDEINNEFMAKRNEFHKDDKILIWVGALALAYAMAEKMAKLADDGSKLVHRHKNSTTPER